MKLAFVTLMSCCLIAVSWQQHYRKQHHQQANVNPYWPLPLHQHRQQLPYYYQEPHQNYPSYYPYYRGPYSPAAAQSYANYYQPYQQQQQTPQRLELDELKLAALLSQLDQQQQQENEKQESRQKQLDLDLLNQLNKESIFIAQHQDLDPFADPEAVKQVFSNDGTSRATKVNEEDSESMARTPIRINKQSQAMARTPFGVLKKKQNSQIENRGFLQSFLFGTQLFARTSTKYTFVTSTITSTNVLSCIVSASFYGGSTQACRRKRSVAEIEADEDQMLLNPSTVNSVEPSAVYDDEHRQPRSAQLVSSFEQSDISSTDDAEMSNYDSYVRVKRLGSAITSTVTTYAITVTASKKTISIGSSLSCLPSGYSVC